MPTALCLFCDYTGDWDRVAEQEGEEHATEIEEVIH